MRVKWGLLRRCCGGLRRQDSGRTLTLRTMERVGSSRNSTRTCTSRVPQACSVLPCANVQVGGVEANMSARAHLSDTATGAGASQDAGDLSELDRAVLHGKLWCVLKCLRNSTSAVPGC